MVKIAPEFYLKTKKKVCVALSFVVLKSKEISSLHWKLRSCDYFGIGAHFLYIFLKFAFFQTLMKFYNTVKFKIINSTREINGFQRTTDFRSLVNLLNIIISYFIRFCRHMSFEWKSLIRQVCKFKDCWTKTTCPTSNYYLLFNFLCCSSNWYQSIGKNS